MLWAEEVRCQVQAELLWHPKGKCHLDWGKMPTPYTSAGHTPALLLWGPNQEPVTPPGPAVSGAPGSNTLRSVLKVRVRLPFKLPGGNSCYWRSQSFLSFLKNFIYLFMAALGLCCYTWTFSSCGYSSCRAWASHCSGFSCCRAWALEYVDFNSCSMWTLEQGLRSCGPQALLPRSMWDLPGSGLEPVSPALAGRFLTLDHQWSLRCQSFERSNQECIWVCACPERTQLFMRIGLGRVGLLWLV